MHPPDRIADGTPVQDMEMDGRNKQKRKRYEERKEEDDFNIPAKYICPLMEHIMVDPVLLECCNILERKAAEQWFRISNRCPVDYTYVTMFQSHHTLKREITTYVNSGPVLLKEQQKQMHDFRLIVNLWDDLIDEEKVKRRRWEEHLAANHTFFSSTFEEPTAVSCHVSYFIHIHPPQLPYPTHPNSIS
jgi:hypothetical protein